MAFQLEVVQNSTFIRNLKDAPLKTYVNDVRVVTNRPELCEARARLLLLAENRIAPFVDHVNNEFTEINLFGNDIDILSTLFAPIMEMKYTNVCDNGSCDSNITWTSSAPISVVTVK